MPIRFTDRGDHRDGIVALTVTAIEPGDREAFHRRVESSEGFDPYYVRATVENVSDENLGNAVFGSFGVVSGESTGAQLFNPNIFASNRGIGDCRESIFPSHADIGAIIETCVVDIVGAGREPAGARWQKPETRYQSDPIIWRR